MDPLLRRIAAPACALLASLAPAAAQSRNVDFLAQLEPAGTFDDYSDIWGYVDPTTGAEYALLCSELGLHVIDCTDPTNPVERGMIPSENPSSSSNFWRDVKTYGSYAYVVSEAYGGIQIVDLSDPNNPTRVGVVATGFFFDAHNIWIDVDAGYAYVCGTSGGTMIFDLSEPTNPVRIRTLPSPTVHDLTALRNFAYFCEQNSNNLDQLDWDLSAETISRMPTEDKPIPH